MYLLSVGTMRAQDTDLQNVRVGFYSMPGYQNISPEGVRSGYGYDFLQFLRRYSHLSFTYLAADKKGPEILDMLRNGEIDLATGFVHVKTRDDDFEFSSPIGFTSVNLYVRKIDGRLLSGQYSTYNGMRVGVVNTEKHLERMLSQRAKEMHFTYQPVYFDNHPEMQKALKAGEIDGICSIEMFQIPGVRVLETFNTQPIYALVKKGNKKLLDEVNTAIGKIDQSIYMWQKRIYQANYLMDADRCLEFLDSEQEYIRQHSTPEHAVKVAVDDDWRPYSWCEDGVYKGIFVEIIDSMMAMAGMKYEFVHTPAHDKTVLDKTDADIYLEFCGTLQDAEEMGLVASPTFMTPTVALISSISLDRIQRLGICRKTPYLNRKATAFVKADTTLYETPDDLFRAVKNGEVDGAFFYNYTAEAYINEQNDNKLQLTIVPGLSVPVYMVTRDCDSRELITVLSKCRYKFNTLKVNDITSKYIASSDREVSIMEFVKAHLGLTISLFLAVILLFAYQKYRSLKIIQKKDAKTRQIAEEANAAKTSFLFNMSHDIRTPMNAIIGFTKLLQKHQEEPEKRADYLNKIEKSSTVLLSIINNVLEMARIEKGRVTIEEIPVKTSEFYKSLCLVFEEMMKSKNLQFSCSTDVQHTCVLVDPTKLREILDNLLSNAYKYTEKGGSISIKVKEVPSKREGYAYYRTTISDTGMGMSEKFLPHLFEEFSREENSTINKIEGTGLGMPIVKRLVELMEGTIEVQSQRGVGTTFVVTIPHKITDEACLTSHAQADFDPDIFKGKRILLAEDNDLNAEIAAEILGELGFVLEHAEDGQSCVEMVEKADAGYYDIILMDIQMPRMNGYEATRAIRQMADPKKAATIILAMTANAFEEDRREAARAGMNGHLTKPINVTELMKTLSANL